MLSFLIVKRRFFMMAGAPHGERLVKKGSRSDDASGGSHMYYVDKFMSIKPPVLLYTDGAARGTS